MSAAVNDLMRLAEILEFEALLLEVPLRPAEDRQVLRRDGVPIFQTAPRHLLPLDLPPLDDGIDGFERAEAGLRQAVDGVVALLADRKVGDFFDEEVFRDATEFHGSPGRRAGRRRHGDRLFELEGVFVQRPSDDHADEVADDPAAMAISRSMSFSVVTPPEAMTSGPSSDILARSSSVPSSIPCIMPSLAMLV